MHGDERSGEGRSEHHHQHAAGLLPVGQGHPGRVLQPYSERIGELPSPCRRTKHAYKPTYINSQIREMIISHILVRMSFYNHNQFANLYFF